MAITVNTAVYHRAIGAAHTGHVEHGEWSAPTGADRTAENSIGHDEAEKGKADEWKYPIFTSDGKLSAKGVGSALGYAEANTDTAGTLVAPLKRIASVIVGDGKKELSMALENAGQLIDRITALAPLDVETLNLSRGPRLSRCVGKDCGSFNVERIAGANGAGPTDRCKDCGTEWPHKPGTITTEQYHGQGAPEETEEQETTPEDQGPVVAEGNIATYPALGGAPQGQNLPETVDWAGSPLDAELRSSTARSLFGMAG